MTTGPCVRPGSPGDGVEVGPTGGDEVVATAVVLV